MYKTSKDMKALRGENGQKSFRTMPPVTQALAWSGDETI
jgi:hypothetical protein